jgi:hypothetical protein
MKNAVFWDVPVLRTVLQLLVTANVVRNSLIISTLMMKAVHSIDTSVLTKTPRQHSPEEGFLLAVTSFAKRPIPHIGAYGSVPFTTA